MEKIEDTKHEESLGETIKTVIYAIVIAGLIRTFWFEPFKIPSGSMYPTLEVGDFLFVSKYTYGYSKHSFPFSFPKFEGRVWQSLPQRGDVVVFKYPADNSTDYIKRIIGLPGDTVQMKDGRLYINGNLVERQKLGRYIIREYTPLPQILKEYEETLPEGRKHRILEYSDDKAVVDNTPEFHVPANHYFMMGDNRDNSNDSRKDVGMVPFDNIEGRARFLFYSHDDTIRWYNPISWFTSIRWKRLFNVIK
jgi:signal peptidase I